MAQDEVLWERDLEKISLMRGPQETSGGRVSVAGQINLETKDPTFEEGSLLLGLGENNLYESALMISGPINEYPAARFTAEMLNHDGEFGILYLVDYQSYQKEKDVLINLELKYSINLLAKMD